MKKLIIAATVAAMTAGVYANTCVKAKVKGECGDEYVEGAGTAHKIAISLKTTVIKKTVSRNKSECTDNCMYWRVQGTKKINGVIWSILDDCNDCTWTFDGQNVALWDSAGPIDAEFAIGVGVYGKGSYSKTLGGYQSKTVEAYGAINGDEFGELAFGTFGTIYSSVKTVDCVDSCNIYVKSLTGGIAGKLVAPEWDATCEDCDLIEYVNCCDDIEPLGYTAAYGTIKITYDTAFAKKVAIIGGNDGDDEDVVEAISATIKGAPRDLEASEISIED